MENKKKKNSKQYFYEFMIYDLNSLYTIEQICLTNNFSYAYCLHNKDKKEDDPLQLKKAHVHFIVYMPFQRTISATAKFFNFPQDYIEYIDDFPSAIRYLIHYDHEDKYQYNRSDIVSNFNLDKYFNTQLDKSNREGYNILKLIDFIKSKENTTLEDLIRFAVSCGLYSDLRRNQNLILRFMYENR